MFPFELRGSAQGRRDGDRLAVDRYGGESSWRDGGSTWQVTFGADGRAAAVEMPASERAERDPVPAELQVAPDPATLALTAIAASRPGTRLNARSYDGRRVIGFALACAETEPAATDELACAISGELLAGGCETRAFRSGNRRTASQCRFGCAEGCRGRVTGRSGWRRRRGSAPSPSIAIDHGRDAG